MVSTDLPASRGATVTVVVETDFPGLPGEELLALMGREMGRRVVVQGRR